MKKHVETPREDIPFKLLLTKRENLDVLENFVQAFLGKEVKLQYAKPENYMMGSSAQNKVVRTDIQAVAEDAIIVIEMQDRLDITFDKRLTLYASRNITDQLQSGESYDKLKKVILISILGERDKRMPDFYTKGVRVIDKHRDIPIVNTVEYHFLDLEKLAEMKDKWDLDDPIQQWGIFLYFKEKEALSMVADRNKRIEKAVEDLERIMADDDIREDVMRIHYDKIDRALEINTARSLGEQEGREIGEAIGQRNGISIGREIGERDGIRIGKTEGKAETIKFTIKNMLKKGFKDDLIAEVTGLTPKELEKQKELLGV